jgi:hypothetical protein
MNEQSLGYFSLQPNAISDILMPDFNLTNRASFQKMVDAQVEETRTLEYKASPALTRSPEPHRLECGPLEISCERKPYT